MLLTGALLVVTTYTKILILTFELNRRLKRKVDEIGILLQFLYGYNSVNFLKPATPLRLPARLSCGFTIVLKIHAVQDKPKKKSLD